MLEQSEGSNHTSKINVFPVTHTIFFLLGGPKVDFIVPCGANKSILWAASRKAIFFYMQLALNNLFSKVLTSFLWSFIRYI